MTPADPNAKPADSRPHVSAQRDDGIGWITFSNPQRRNAVTFDMWRQIPAIIADFAQDPLVRVVALRGAGAQAFISGADISEFGRLRSTPAHVTEYDRVGREAVAAIAGIGKPTVAVIRGWCVGGGLGTAIACDLRIAAADSRFAVPAAKLGLGYRYPGVKALVDVIGPANAAEILLTARQYDAAEALRMGLINRALPVEGFEAEAVHYLSGIAANAPLTLKAVKLSVRAAVETPAPATLDRIDAAISACFESEDYKEGRAAFAEKRPPRFQGR